MRVCFADNVRSRLVDVIDEVLPTAAEARFAVAFVKHSGLSLIERSLKACLANGGHVEFVVGLDFHTTDAHSLRALSDLARSSENCQLFCYSDPSDEAATYHPKLYLATRHSVLTAVVGSSNLTQGGLRDNVEVNAVLRLDRDADEAQALFDLYARLKYQRTCFIPDSAYIDAYDEVAARVRAARERATADSGTRIAVDAIRERERALPRPVVSPDALRGWQRLVYASLPEGEFTTESTYRHVPEFLRTYPSNRHPEAKVRQVLQQLRDLGLVTHLGQGRWVRGRDASGGAAGVG